MDANQVIAHATVLKEKLDTAKARSASKSPACPAARRAVTLAHKRLVAFLEVMSQGGIEAPFDKATLLQ